MKTVTINFKDYLQLMREDFKSSFSLIEFSIKRNKNILNSLYSKNIFIRFLKSQEIKDREEFCETSLEYLKEAFQKHVNVENAAIKPATVTIRYYDYECLLDRCYNINSLPRRYYVEN